MVERRKVAGEQQQKRAENRKNNQTRQELIKGEVFYNENSKHLFPGVRHDYKEVVQEPLQVFDVQEKSSFFNFCPRRRIDHHVQQYFQHNFF
jgi:hypothetical protein